MMSNANGTSMRSVSWLKDSRLWWMVFSSFWVLMILNSAYQYFSHDVIEGDPDNVGAVWRSVAIIGGIAFVVIYCKLMYQVYFRETWELHSTTLRLVRFGLLGLAIVLNVLPKSEETGFSFAFIFVAIAFVLTGEPDRAFHEVLQICTVAAVVLLISGNGERIGATLLFTIAFGFMVAAQHRNFGLIRDLYVERSRVRDQAVTEERFRLARDLHDTVGHSMAQITLKAELARRTVADDPARAVDELEQIELLSRALSTEVRRSIAGETTLSLANEIDRGTELLQSMKIDVTFNGNIAHIPEEIADVFAWCLREGVMNVIKHSGASRCEVIFTQNDEHHGLNIADNGSIPIENGNGGQGIQGMKQRVEGSGGELVFGATDSGHALTIRIPA